MSRCRWKGLRVLDLTPAAARRLLLAAAGRLRRRRDQGRGHRDGRLRPLVAAVLRGRRADRPRRAVPGAQPRQALDPHRPQDRARARRCCCGSPATPTCCSSPSGPGCSTASASATSACAQENPRLVYCAITGYGQDGPNRDRSGHDMNYLGLNGLLGLTGDADGPPVQAAGQIADIGGGALMARDRDPGGAARARALRGGAARRLLDVRRLAVVAGAGGGRGVRHRAAPRAAASCSWPARSSATGPTAAPTATSRSARSSRSSGRRSATASGARTCSTTRSIRRAPTRTRAVTEIFAERTREQWRQFASEHDCCLEPVLELDEALDSELVAAREMVVELAQPGAERPVKLLGRADQAEPHARRPGTRAGSGARRAHRRGARRSGLRAPRRSPRCTRRARSPGRRARSRARS